MNLSRLKPILTKWSGDFKSVPLVSVITLGWGRGVIRQHIVQSPAFDSPELIELRDHVLASCTNEDLKLAFDGLALRQESALRRIQALSSEEPTVRIGSIECPLKIALAAFVGAIIAQHEPRLICNRLQISQTRRTMLNVRRHLADWLLRHVEKYSA